MFKEPKIKALTNFNLDPNTFLLQESHNSLPSLLSNGARMTKIDEKLIRGGFYKSTSRGLWTPRPPFLIT